MKFKGKVSGWFYGVTIGVAVILIFIITMSIIDNEIWVLMMNVLGLILIELFCIPIILHNYVELQDEMLVIVFGWIKKEIPYEDIISLSSTHNPLSSLAASFDRIEIKCKSQSDVMISVIDKEGLLSEMNQYNPSIKIRRRS